MINLRTWRWGSWIIRVGPVSSWGPYEREVEGHSTEKAVGHVTAEVSAGVM